MNGASPKSILGKAADLPSSSSGAAAGKFSGPFRRLAFALGVLALIFGKPLFDLVRYSLHEEFYSHIILIPFICAYLIWIDRSKLPAPAHGNIGLAAIPALAGLALLAGWWISRGALSRNDSLTWTILPFCLFLTSLVVWFLGSGFTKAIAFPLAFFFFIVPFPEAVTNGFEIASQKASADVYSWMLVLTGTPFFREGQEFRIPGLSLVVAQECSGIRSSFVLLLTSLLAGQMFLRSRWKRAFLTFAVIPLGIVRNGFRVLTLSLLTIYVDPRVIDSPLHHRGGPIFFALSLIPFFIMLWWLRKSDARSAVGGTTMDIPR